MISYFDSRLSIPFDLYNQLYDSCITYIALLYHYSHNSDYSVYFEEIKKQSKDLYYLLGELIKLCNS